MDDVTMWRNLLNVVLIFISYCYGDPHNETALSTALSPRRSLCLYVSDRYGISLKYRVKIFHVTRISQSH